MTINKKISLTLGIIVVIIAAGTAITQHAQSRQYSYQNSTPVTTPAATPATTPSPTTAPKTTPTPTPSAKAPNTYTLADVAAHNNGTSCWSAINGGVYDLTSWINQHPGGPEAILSICGKDGSTAFNAQHGGQSRPANELAGFRIGTLAAR